MNDKELLNNALRLHMYMSLQRNVKLNSFHKTDSKLRKFLSLIGKKHMPLIKISDTNLSEKLKNSLIKKVSGEVIAECLAWLKKNSHTKFIKFMEGRIKTLKKVILKSMNKKQKNTPKISKKMIVEDSDTDESETDDYEETEDELYETESDESDESDGMSSDDETDISVDSNIFEDDDAETEDEDEEESEEESDDESDEEQPRKMRRNKRVPHKKKRVSQSKIKFEKVQEYILKMNTRNKENMHTYMHSFKNLSHKQRAIIMKQIKMYSCNETYKPILFKVLLSQIPEDAKQDVMTRIQQSRSDDSGKFKEWLDGLLTVPFGKHVEAEVNTDSSKSKIQSFLNETRDCLDEAVHGHKDAKQKIMQFIAQTVTNPSPHGLVLGIEGPMGNGKTTLIEKGFSKALKRPFVAIPLGGIQDGSFLEGHGYTYEGSRPGAIVAALMKTKCMNPVIYMDELDKVSQTERGEEIIHLLIHLVDPSQNHHFRDKYFAGIPFDLSRATFIFSYNDADRINPVLMDRITHLKTRGFRLSEKVIISQNYLLKSIFTDVGIQKEKTIEITDETLEWIVQNYTHEGGVRDLKKILYEVIREINLRSLTTKSMEFPYGVTKEELENDYLKNFRMYKHEKIPTKSVIGKINGMYATNNDTGGITVIEASWVPSDSRLRLELTGRQGDVMRESMQVAKTLAWKLLSPDMKKKWQDEWNSSREFQGIHVHCPEGGVPKDGPSAGAAITTALYSLLSERPIRHTIAVTGEITLSGKVTEIGGLESKIFGAKMAGCKMVLCPRDNAKDVANILDQYGDKLKKDKFEIKMVDTIDEVFEIFLKKPQKKAATSAPPKD